MFLIDFCACFFYYLNLSVWFSVLAAHDSFLWKIEKVLCFIMGHIKKLSPSVIQVEHGQSMTMLKL